MRPSTEIGSQPSPMAQPEHLSMANSMANEIISKSYEDQDAMIRHIKMRIVETRENELARLKEQVDYTTKMLEVARQ